MLRRLALTLGAIAGLVVLMAQAAPYRYSEQPVVAVPNIDNVQLDETSATHVWPLTDASGSGAPGPCATQQAADAISAGATGMPSPVPLNVSSPTSSPFPYCGDPGIVKDGSAAFEFTNGIGALQGQWLTPATTGILSTLCNNNAGGSCTQAFSIECVVLPVQLGGSAAHYFFDVDGTTSGLGLGMSALTGPVLDLNGTNVTNFAESSSNVPYDLVYTFNPTGNISDVYVNGVLAEATSSPAPQASANSVTYIGSQTGAANGWSGRIQKCATYNITLNDGLVRLHFLSTGFF